MTEAEMLTMLSRAVTTTHGIEIETTNPDSFKGLFYRVRNKHALKLSCRTAPSGENKLWIVHDEN